MNNIILFPGTDAVENPILRARSLSLPNVKEQLLITEEIILNHYGEKIELVEYMELPNDLSLEGFRKLVLCSLATQVALYRNYVVKNGMPDCVMGLSLGDVPRSVVAGITTYEHAAQSLYMFTKMNHLARPGACVHVKLDIPFSEAEDILTLEKYNIEFSVIQNEKFGLIAGPEMMIKKWIKEVAIPKQIKFRPMYPFPLHTSMMKPLADNLLPFVSAVCNFENKTTDIFSTVYGKLLEDKYEAILDCTTNISSALNFPDVIQKAIDHFGEVAFINIGPSDSLLKFLSFMELPKSTIYKDWYQESLAA